MSEEHFIKDRRRLIVQLSIYVNIKVRTRSDPLCLIMDDIKTTEDPLILKGPFSI